MDFNTWGNLIFKNDTTAIISKPKSSTLYQITIEKGFNLIDITDNNGKTLFTFKYILEDENHLT